MNYYYDPDGLPVNDKNMQKIIHAVKRAISKLKFGKAYQLKEIVNIDDSDLWDSMSHHTVRSAGVTFRNLVEDGEIQGLDIRNKNESPRKYIRTK